MEKERIYVAPQVEVVDVKVEKGFALSPGEAGGEIDPWQ